MSGRRRRGRARSAAPARRACARRGGPGPARRAADAVSSRSHGSTIASGSRRSLAYRSSGGGQPRSSAPSRGARSTRVSTSAPSENRASQCAEGAGPAAGRGASPSTLRAPAGSGGRGTPPSDAVRSPRSSMRARVLALRVRARAGRGPPRRRDPRRAARRPGRAASAGAPRAARAPAVDASAAGNGEPGTAASSSSRSSGESTSIARSRRARRSRTSIARDLGEPARQRVVGGEVVGQARERRRGARDRDDVRRVAVVRERAGGSPAAASTNARRSSGVASGIDPAPRTTRPAGSELPHEPARAAPRTAWRRVARGGRRPSSAPAARNATRWRSASAARASSRSATQRPGAGVRRGGEDEDGDGRHHARV